MLTSEEKYNAVIDKDFPDPNGESLSCIVNGMDYEHSGSSFEYMFACCLGSKEDSSLPMVVVPGPLPVYLRLPYRRDLYFCFQQEEKRARFVSILNDCIRHQNQGKCSPLTTGKMLRQALHLKV